MLIVPNIHPIEISSIYAIVGTFFIFPVAVLTSKLVGADPFSKENRLRHLIGYRHMSVVTMSFPILLILFFKYPEGLLLGMAIAYCLDFYVLSWAFGSPIFDVTAAIRFLLVSCFWVLLPDQRMLAIPIIAILSYIAIIVLTLTTRTKWLAKYS